MATTFSEMREEYQNSDKTEDLRAGDTCQESDECEHELFELHHPRNAQTDAKRHPDAPETEVVCIHHGIVAAR